MPVLRFIPTYVGHTLYRMQYRAAVRFIPTYVGHTCPLELLARPIFGSSPPTWGIHSPPARTSSTYRFIPTYVGHTATKSSDYLHGTVHPHIRGAYHEGSVIYPLAYGSSPHTWGILGQDGRENGQGRFIPTYVGHTVLPGVGDEPRTVHPHIRGAYNCFRSRRANSYGSSPHTWGIQQLLINITD